MNFSSTEVPQNRSPSKLKKNQVVTEHTQKYTVSWEIQLCLILL